jgi:eukaryotic-like serine/threonine-protein kinase
VVRALRTIAGIGEVCRSWQEPGEGGGGDAVEQGVAGGPEGTGGPGPRRWGPLEILEKVGEGSFGEVYRARDLRLDRVVALKLLREGGAREGDEEVLAEARLLARVRHPNVATVYGADRHDLDGGRVGFWMEFIAGSTLAELLAEQGHFGAGEAALAGVEVCRALAAVHAEGIVHRDVKAQNVMRAKGGRIVLTDFGIGMDLRGDGAAERSLSGTPLYLAPEVLAGEAATVRSDVYALGVLLYYLVTGSFPVRGRSLEELRRAHERGGARLLRDARPDLPERFVRAVEKALARDPAERHPSAGAFEKALNRVLRDETSRVVTVPRRRRPRAWWPAAVAVLGALLLIAYLWIARRPPQTASAPPPPQASPKVAVPAAPPERLLVADFENRTDVDFFDAGRHLLILALEQSPRLRVLPQGRIVEVLDLMRRPKGTRLDAPTAREICQRENLGTLITGEIVPSGKTGYNLLVTATDPESGAPRAVQPEKIQGKEDFIRAVDAVAARLREGLGESPAVVEKSRRPLEQVTTASLPALERFTQALDFQAHSQPEKAIDSLRLAVDLDPEFALAYGRLAIYLGGPGRLREALSSAEKAYRLRSKISRREQYRIAGIYHMTTMRYEEAMKDYNQALLLDPEDAETRRQLALLHVNIGRPQEGLTAARAARDSQRDNALNEGVLVLMLAIADEPQKALKELAGARVRFPGEPYLFWGEGVTRIMLRDPTWAATSFRALAKKGEEEQGDPTFASLGRLYLAQTMVYEGRLQPAIGELEAGLALDAREKFERTQKIRNEYLAKIFLQLGDTKEARRQVEQIESQLEDVPAHLKPMRNAALLRIGLGDLRQAERLLARIEKLRDRYPGNLSRGFAAQVRGEIERARGAKAAARDHLDEARLQWEDPSTLGSLAHYWMAENRCDKALPILQEILAQKGWIFHEFFIGDWVLAHRDVARCQAKLGQFDQARASYATFLKLWGTNGTDLPDVKDARRELQELNARSPH